MRLILAALLALALWCVAPTTAHAQNPTTVSAWTSVTFGPVNGNDTLYFKATYFAGNPQRASNATAFLYEEYKYYNAALALIGTQEVQIGYWHIEGFLATHIIVDHSTTGLTNDWYTDAFQYAPVGTYTCKRFYRLKSSCGGAWGSSTPSIADSALSAFQGTF